MTPEEFKIEVESFACSKHGEYIRTSLVRGFPRITYCCCAAFRKKMLMHIEIRSKYVELPPELVQQNKKTLSDKQLEKAVDTVDELSPLIEKAKLELEKGTWPHAIPSAKIQSAKIAYDKLISGGYDNSVMLSDLKEIIEEAETLSAKINANLEERYAQWQQEEETRKKEKTQAAIERRRAREEKLKEAAAEKKRKEALRLAKELSKKEQEKAEEERDKVIIANIPQWTKSLKAAQKFIEEHDSRSYLVLLSKDDMRRIIMVAGTLLEAIAPIRKALMDKSVVRRHSNLLIEYNTTNEKLQFIIKFCSDCISRSSVSKRKRTIEIQKDNKREDGSYFRKMHRLYEEKINSTDKWYENESRRFFVNRHEDVREYLDAYGRTVRNNILKADVIIEGKEDIDEWGFFRLDGRFLPFCLREKNVINETIEYHLYTFNVVHDTYNYAFDDIITDRIMYLQEKGIK